MIGWLGFLAKMLTFTLEKITGKVIDLQMDDRRRAARRFMAVYHVLSDLEVLAKEVIVELKYIVATNDPSIQRDWLREISVAVDETSQRFLEATLGLGEVLRIFDSVLASTVSALEAGKFSFLILAAHGFELEGKDANSEGIKYTYPKPDLESLDLQQYYRWYEEHYPLDATDSLEWPEWVICGYVQEDDVCEDRVVLREPKSADRLLSLLTEHLAKIGVAREQLGEFLRKHFTSQDLLAMRSPVQQFDRLHVMYRMSDAVGTTYTRFFASRPARRIQMQQDDQELADTNDPKGSKPT